jgi:hypothetical protein
MYMRIGPPSRSLTSEITIGALIFVGALAASMLTSLFLSVCLSAIPLMAIRGNDEGAVFAAGVSQAAVFNCIGLLVNPVIFVSIATNHCRRVTPYFVALSPIVWLLQLGLLSRQHWTLKGQPFLALVSTATGIGLAYWLLRKKDRYFRSHASAPATSH